MIFQLVMPEDADAAKGLISTTSPIGRALLNKEPGDTVKVVTPGGTREFEIVKLVTIHDEAAGMTDRDARRPRRLRTLLSATPHRARPDRHRHRRRLSRRRAARAPRSRRQARHRRRPRRRRRSARCSRRSTARSGCGTTRGSGAPPAVARLYAWRSAPRVVAVGARAVAWRSSRCRSPSMALGLIVFPIDFVLKMVGVGGAAGWSRAYLRLAEAAFAPDGAADLAAAAGAAACSARPAVVAVVDGWLRRPARRRRAAPSWWRVRARRRCRRAGAIDALLARDVGSGARRGAAEAADAGRAGAAIHRDAGREHRPARVPRAADRRRTTSTRTATWCSRWSARARRRDLMRRPTDQRGARRAAPRCSIWPAWRAIIWPMRSRRR